LARAALKNQETYVCDPLLLAEDWLVAQVFNGTELNATTGW